MFSHVLQVVVLIVMVSMYVVCFIVKNMNETILAFFALWFKCVSFLKPSIELIKAVLKDVNFM